MRGSHNVPALEPGSLLAGIGPTMDQTKDATGRPPAPSVRSIGEIAGLRPHRRPRDGGEVPGADVDLVDALDPLTWRTVAAWLQERPAAGTRQTRLQIMSAFLRWLHLVEPALDPLAVTGAHLDAYCDAALTGALNTGVRSPGKPLSKGTVARKRNALSAFYAFAWRSGTVRDTRRPDSPAAHDAAGLRTLTREERRLLRRGIARLASDGRSAEAAAVALLDGTGAAPGALARLTLQDTRTLPFGRDAEPVIVTLPDRRGDLVAFPIPAPARPLLRMLSAGRSASDPLLRQDDGQPADPEWITVALTHAALAGGIPEGRARLLRPHMMRATTITELLHDAGAHGR
ncbi:hypothetical protein [Nonomuraea zeae]|uniref:Core-binding (CB) domain-containing protein n=1 Tax=Nonomuraea zeae TaxID=1642303 RepID=A0A5S4GHQ5_9ACTN|nr:hypothetical protein [Nonomuraea zeae]TMR32483.1 hypothetical protein ETD85_22840 [Nonomuraea zeae]